MPLVKSRKAHPGPRRVDELKGGNSTQQDYGCEGLGMRSSSSKKIRSIMYHGIQLDAARIVNTVI